MINASFFLAEPVEFKKDIVIYPPLVKDVITPAFTQYRQILISSQEDIEDRVRLFLQQAMRSPDASEEVKNMDINKEVIERTKSPFDLLLINSYSEKWYEHIAKKAFQFFLKEEVSFDYEEKRIFIGNLEEEILKATKPEDFRFITEKEFFGFQNALRAAMGEAPIEEPIEDEHPRVKEMKAKARERDRIKAKKEGGGVSLETSLVAICCMGIGITPLNIGEMSYAAVNYLISMYQQKEHYEVDIQSLMAGADSKKVKPKYWIKNLEK